MEILLEFFGMLAQRDSKLKGRKGKFNFILAAMADGTQLSMETVPS